MNKTTDMSPADEESKPMRQILLKTHKLLGISTGIVIFVLCFTGAISLFATEISVWESAALSNASSGAEVPPEQWPINHMLDQARKTYGGKDGRDVEVFYMGKSDDKQRYLSSWTHTESDEAWHYSYWDASTGELITHQEMGISEVLAEMHRALWLPNPYGNYLVGLFGVILMIMAIGGIIIHLHWRRDAETLRLDTDKRHKWSDLHKVAGLWALPFHIVIGFTGALFGLLGVILILVALVAYGGDQDRAVAEVFGKDPSPTHQQVVVPTVNPFITKAKKDMQAGFSPNKLMLVYPGDENMFVLVYGGYPKSLTMDSFAKYRLDTGEAIKLVDYEHGPAALKAYGITVPLHYATFGGLAMKILYAGLAIMTAILPATGVLLWLRRRKSIDRKSRFVFWALLSIPVASSIGFVAAVVIKWLAATIGLDFSTTALDISLIVFVLSVIGLAVYVRGLGDFNQGLLSLLKLILFSCVMAASIDLVMQSQYTMQHWDSRAWGTDIGLILVALLCGGLMRAVQGKLQPINESR